MYGTIDYRFGIYVSVAVIQLYVFVYAIKRSVKVECGRHSNGNCDNTSCPHDVFTFHLIDSMRGLYQHADRV